MSPQLTNPLNDPHEQLKKKIILQMKDKIFNEEMVTDMKDTYVELLQGEFIVFTRNEKRRLLKVVLQEIFDDILVNI